MNTQTEHAIAKLQKLLPSMVSIHAPTIQLAITALLRSAEVDAVQQARITKLEAQIVSLGGSVGSDE